MTLVITDRTQHIQHNLLLLEAGLMADLKDQVEANRTFLIDNIIWDDIRHYMRQELFSRRDDENIQACRINREKIGMCLELLPFRQHPDGYKVFMSSLTESYPHVRQKIECTEIANKKLDGHTHEIIKGEMDLNAMLKLSRHPDMKNWRMLARSLKLSDGDIAQIEYAHDRNLRECVYNMLSLWNGQRSRTEATKEAVYQALVEVDMVNAAEELYEK